MGNLHLEALNHQAFAGGLGELSHIFQNQSSDRFGRDCIGSWRLRTAGLARIRILKSRGFRSARLACLQICVHNAVSASSGRHGWAYPSRSYALH